MSLELIWSGMPNIGTSFGVVAGDKERYKHLSD
jgi:hypothetical protein